MSAHLRMAARVYTAIWLVSAVGAIAGRLAGGAAAAPGAARGDGSLFASVLATNARLVAALVVAAVLVSAVPDWRWALDTVVAWLLVLNPVAIGAAVGAGGRHLAGVLVHVPLEWAALTAAGTLYLAARHRVVTSRAAVGHVGIAVVLLVISAAVEAWAPALG